MKTQTLSSVSVITLQFPSFGNPNAEREIEIIFDFEAGTVAWRNRVFKVNERLIAVSKVYSDKGFKSNGYEYKTEVVSVESTMQLMMKKVNSYKQPNQAINFLNELVGTVLVSNWEINELDTTSYNFSAIQPETDNTRDAQQVLRNYDVVGFEVKSNGLMGKGLWVEGCLETATKHWGFALPDKTNKKRAKVADAVVVSGRSIDGTKSIVHADKAEKQLNRETMLKHIAAELPVVHEDALVSELHDGKFAVSYGLADYSLLLNDPLLSLAVGDAGIVNREPINYVANKLLRGGINLELLFSGNPEYQSELGKRVKSLSLTNNRTAQVQAVIEDVRAEMKAHELNETVLQPGETIEFKEQAVVTNFNTFPVRVHKVKSVRQGAFINTECRSLVIEVHTKAEFEDYNAKLRGQWIKGMTTRNDDYVVKDGSGEPVDARFILNHKTGFSTDNKVVEVHAFLSLVADANSCPHLLAEYGFRLGSSLECWKDDVNSREKAFVKGSPLFTTHGMKVLANSMAGYESVNGVKVPVIWINSNNPLGTVDKNGKKVKQIKDGDVVLFYRNPVVDLTPGIIRFNDRACGKFTCAVSPSVLAWSSQTDNDGDTLWIVPLKQVRISSVDTQGERGDEVKSAVFSMMNHPLVGKKVAIEAMQTFGAGDLFAGIIKPRSNFGADVEDVVGDSDPNIIDLAEAVANHYTVRVGQGYSLMFNAFNSFTTKFHKQGFKGFDRAEIVAIKASSFVFYEEFGLAGFSAGNEDQFAKLTKSALERLGKTKVSSSGLLTRKNKGGSKDSWFYASKFRAQSIIQSKTELCKHFGDVELKFGTSESQQIKVEALNNGLFRTLTKGHLNQEGCINGIFTSLNEEMIDNAHPFADAMLAWAKFVNGGLVA